MSKLALAIGLVLAVEGLLYVLFPAALKKMLMQMGDINPESLRIGGVLALAVGVLIIWLSGEG